MANRGVDFGCGLGRNTIVAESSSKWYRRCIRLWVFVASRGSTDTTNTHNFGIHVNDGNDCIIFISHMADDNSNMARTYLQIYKERISYKNVFIV